jgi:hypothetical protein
MVFQSKHPGRARHNPKAVSFEHGARYRCAGHPLPVHGSGGSLTAATRVQARGAGWKGLRRGRSQSIDEPAPELKRNLFGVVKDQS